MTIIHRTYLSPEDTPPGRALARWLESVGSELPETPPVLSLTVGYGMIAGTNELGFGADMGVVWLAGDDAIAQAHRNGSEAESFTRLFDPSGMVTSGLFTYDFPTLFRCLAPVLRAYPDLFLHLCGLVQGSVYEQPELTGDTPNGA